MPHSGQIDAFVARPRVGGTVTEQGNRDSGPAPQFQRQAHSSRDGNAAAHRAGSYQVMFPV